MKKQPTFSWDEETGSTICLLFDKENTYYGTATCSPTDYDMKSEKVGCEIAYHRAVISALQSRRDELKIKLKALKEYYYTMNKSKYFDENSYPIKRLLSQMEILKHDIILLKEEIQNEKNYLTEYMNNKADFYTKIRRNRKVNLNQ